MFSKLLIANRGEIACRIARTARRLGIRTVAVYSEADAEALHVRACDEAVAIGRSPAAESYLRADAIVAACRETGADAVHPGFGFLSERAEFAEALADAGIAFVGPPPGAIRAMGDKIESKRLARKAGVSVVPGFVGEVVDLEAARDAAGEIGYPVMIKASAGGGGKGMRIAHAEADLMDGLRSAMAEARKSFGDDRVFVEKYVTEPRHIEIQVLADAHGNCVYLGERECSIQRRHQKVIEEAPSPFLDPETRRRMGEQAVALAKAVGYRSAGTVEFIVDKDRNFYFLEMNTRLQVEHPVTEMVTGLDIVELMLRVADGEPLPFGQDDVKLDGWSIEARLYAEDPTRNFAPSTGRLRRFVTPREGRHVRIDTGVGEGSEISVFYDPMIAKLVTWGPDRAAAIAHMQRALDGFYVRGITHNLNFLNAIMAKPRFAEGRLTTAFIAEEFPDGFADAERAHALSGTLVPVAAALHQRRAERELTVAGQVGGRRIRVPHEWRVRIDGEAHDVAVELVDDGADVVTGGRSVTVRGEWVPGQPVFEGEVDGRPVVVQVDWTGSAYRMTHGGASVRVEVLAPRVAALAALMPEKAPPDTTKFLLSPMPGLLVSVAVAEGDEVKAGEELAVVEAMKMENILRAERDGRIKTVAAAPGASLAADQVILEFE